MKRAILVILALSIAGGFYYAAIQRSVPQEARESQEETPQESVETVSATAVVVPNRWAQLSFKASGFLEEVLVEEGDEVRAGQVLARLDQADLEMRVEEAQAALDLAQANLAQVKTGPRPEEIAAAEATVAMAEAQLARARRGADPQEIKAAQGALKEAEASLRLAQAEYDKISWLEGIGMTPQALALEEATVRYEIAKANYEAVLRRPTPEDVAIAEAAVQQAKAQAALVRAGPSAEAIAIAEAQVAQAQVALDHARATLADAELKAPFAGTVANLSARPGEWVLAGNALVALGDLSSFQIETTDLSELDVDRLKPGQKVEITFDALPQTKLYGRVAKIAPKSSEAQGGTNYKVTVELEEQDPALRWGMTAFVDIIVGE